MRIKLKNKVIDANRNDTALIQYIEIYYFISTVNLFVKLYLGGLSGWEIMSRGLLGLLVVRGAWTLYVSRKITNLILPEFVMLIVYAFSFIIGEAGASRLFSSMLNVMLGYIPLGVFLYSINDLRKLERNLYLFSWPSFVMLSIVIISNAARGTSNYDMAGGYGLLLPVMMFYQSFFEKRKWSDVLAGIFGTSIILIYCSRGPLLCIAVYFALISIKSISLSSTKSIIKTAVIITVLVLIVIYHQIILEVILRLFVNRGFGGRSINLLLNDITHDSGRAVMHDFYRKAIAERPFLGWGVLGGWNYGSQTYPHSIYLEFQLSFGRVFGIILIVLFGLLVLDAFFSARADNKSLAIIIISATVYLLYSDSFMQSYLFFMCIGICLRVIKDKQLKKVVESGTSLAMEGYR